MDILEIGTVPAEEECQQVGTSNYNAAKARKECRIYKEYLERLFPIPKALEEELSYFIKTCPHDYGNYYEVAIRFNSENKVAVDFAYNVEEKSPTNWDEKALVELRSSGLIVRSVIIGLIIPLLASSINSLAHFYPNHLFSSDRSEVLVSQISEGEPIRCRGCSRRETTKLSRS